MASNMSDKELKVQKTIHWMISDFTKEFAEQKNARDKITSNTAVLMYEGNKTEWFLRIFSNGFTEEKRGNVGLFLYLKSADVNNFLAKFKFGIVKKSGGIVNLKSCELEGNSFPLDGWGYKKCISHEDLENTECLSNGKLTIMCELSLYAESQSVLKDKETSNPFSGYKIIFDDELLCDFGLKMNDGVTLKAHKTVLIARSPVFRTMLTTDMKEAATSSVEVPDFDSKTMRELLRFMYCVEVEQLEKIASDLIFAAEKYEIIELKALCFDQIISKLSEENVLDALIIADRVSESEKLLTPCVGIVARVYDTISSQPKWKQLSNEMLNKILKKILTRQGCEVIHV